MRKAVGIGLAMSLAACGGGEGSLDIETQREYFTRAVETVASDGGEPFSLDKRIPCDFGLLVGELTVQRVLADEDDYSAVVVADSLGNVPDFGLVDCFDTDDDHRIVRGNDGY